MMTFDDDPNSGSGYHVGSAYIDGWYGYVNKDLRAILGQSEQGPFSRTYCGGGSLSACRTALLNSLSDALGVQSSDLYDEDPNTAGTQRVSGCPAAKTDQWCWDSIRYRSLGVLTLPTIHWINRPTFQQAVEIPGHRPRGFPRPKGATPLRASLVLAYKGCSSPNRTHGGPLDVGSCSPPQQRSDYLTVGTLDSNGQPAKFTGSVRLDVFQGNTSTEADEADVNVQVNMSDVRKKADLSDYAGEVSVNTSLRMTDRNNGGAAGNDPATAFDVPFPVTVPCSATTDTTIGGDCSVNTSFDAILPGTVVENARQNWQLTGFQVFDGGSDGLVSTSPNTLFATQGVFTP
jgi:hypothetical protein